MALLKLLAILMLIAVALSGCNDDKGTDDGVDPTDPTDPTDPSTPVDPTDPGEPADEAYMFAGDCTGTATAVAVGSIRVLCNLSDMGYNPELNYESAALVVSWDAADATVLDVMATFEGTQCNQGGDAGCDYGANNGLESPLRVELADASSWLADGPMIAATPSGLTASMSFDLHVELYSGPIPGNATAAQ